MKFGKEFSIHLEETLPEWRDKYLCYKPLKKLLKHIPSPTPDYSPPTDLHNWFITILNDELHKFNDFYVDKEEDFIIRFQYGSLKRTENGQCFLFPYLNGEELKERIERVKDKSDQDGFLATDNEFSEEIMSIRKDFVSIHGEMVLLKNYSSLNFAGLVKILKKYDKRTGGLLRLPFTQVALHQPIFTTEPLTRLVRECEANLEVLFPLEAEVVESAGPADKQMGATSSYASNVSPDTTFPPGEENGDIYRSTLAAIRAIQGLKKASSTYNPLSFSSISGNQDNDSPGAVTAEDSDSDSLVASQNGEEMNQEVSSSPK